MLARLSPARLRNAARLLATFVAAGGVRIATPPDAERPVLLTVPQLGGDITVKVDPDGLRRAADGPEAVRARVEQHMGRVAEALAPLDVLAHLTRDVGTAAAALAGSSELVVVGTAVAHRDLGRLLYWQVVPAGLACVRLIAPALARA